MLEFDYFYRTKIDNYNAVDGKIDRTSLSGKYEIDKETNRPKNPQGRTGCMLFDQKNSESI